MTITLTSTAIAKALKNSNGINPTYENTYMPGYEGYLQTSTITNRETGMAKNLTISYDYIYSFDLNPDCGQILKNTKRMMLWGI